MPDWNSIIWFVIWAVVIGFSVCFITWLVFVLSVFGKDKPSTRRPWEDDFFNRHK